jgi:hypothetical protein
MKDAELLAYMVDRIGVAKAFVEIDERTGSASYIEDFLDAKSPKWVLESMGTRLPRSPEQRRDAAVHTLDALFARVLSARRKKVRLSAAQRRVLREFLRYRPKTDRRSLSEMLGALCRVWPNRVVHHYLNDSDEPDDEDAESGDFEEVLKIAGRYYYYHWCDDYLSDGFRTLRGILNDMGLSCYGIQAITCPQLTARQLASMLRVTVEPGYVVQLNGEEWITVEDKAAPRGVSLKPNLPGRSADQNPGAG